MTLRTINKMKTGKEVNMMFELTKGTGLIKKFHLQEPKDFVHFFGLVYYKKAAIKKIAQCLGMEPKIINPELLISKRKPKREKYRSENEIKLKDYIKENESFIKRKKKIALLKSLLVVPRIQRQNFKN